MIWWMLDGGVDVRTIKKQERREDKIREDKKRGMEFYFLRGKGKGKERRGEMVDFRLHVCVCGFIVR